MRQLSGIDQRPDQQGIFDAPDWQFQPGSATSVAAAAPAQLTTASAAPAPQPAEPIAVARGYGLVLQGRGYGQPGLYVAEVAAGSPFDGTLRAGDVILKFNSVTPAGPQGVISALDRDRRASVNLQHDGLGVPISIQLVLPKDTDE